MMARRRPSEATAELLKVVEETAAEARLWAARLEEAVERNRTAATELAEQAEGGVDDAGTNDE